MLPDTLEQLAKNIGFVKRKSKYRAQDLVDLCVWLSQNVARSSLTQLCSLLEANTGISMSPEGLNQRFNPQAVQFLQQLLAHLLHQQFCSSSKIPTLYTNYFRRIRVWDATHFQIPEKFIDQLQPGETYEIPKIYIGMYQKLPARLILYKLTANET